MIYERIIMNPDAALRIKPGDMVNPHPLWNRSERTHRQIETPTEVLAVSVEGGCQSGVMVTVRQRNGQPITLDAAWLMPV